MNKKIQKISADLPKRARKLGSIGGGTGEGGGGGYQ